MTTVNTNQVDPDLSEISLREIIRFLKRSWKIIAFTSLLGLGVSVAYLKLTPAKYEAVAQIMMAQISSSGNNSNNNLSPIGINIEEPLLLISRLSSPTSFTPEVLDACGLGDIPAGSANLSRLIKLSSLKGVSNVVEIKVFGNSPEAAKTCANSIFELIKVTQAQIMAPFIQVAKIKLADDKDRLAKAKDFVVKADKSGAVMGAAYLSTRDEILFLLDEIAALTNIVIGNEDRATRLVAPIYAEESPISPKKRAILILGIILGSSMGLLISLALNTLKKLKG